MHLLMPRYRHLWLIEKQFLSAIISFFGLACSSGSWRKGATPCRCVCLTVWQCVPDTHRVFVSVFSSTVHEYDCVSAGHFVMVTRRVTRTHARSDDCLIYKHTHRTSLCGLVYTILHLCIIFVSSLYHLCISLHRGWNKCVLASAACSTDSSQPAICDTRPTRTLKSHC